MSKERIDKETKRNDFGIIFRHSFNHSLLEETGARIVSPDTVYEHLWNIWSLTMDCEDTSDIGELMETIREIRESSIAAMEKIRSESQVEQEDDFSNYECGVTGLPCCECSPVCSSRREKNEMDY